jgi:hypothetical protein
MDAENTKPQLTLNVEVQMKTRQNLLESTGMEELRELKSCIGFWSLSTPLNFEE